MIGLLASLALATCLLIGRLLYNWFQLRHIPGPFLAGTTNLWRAYYQYKGLLRDKIVQLHEEHGPVVRYGVNMISLRDASAVHSIYAGKGFTIHDSYRVLLGIKDGKEVESLVTVRDEHRHGQLRRAVANAFTPTSAAEMEHLVDATLQTLMEMLEQRGEFDLSQQLTWYSLDTAGSMLFSEEFGCLKSNSDARGVAALVHSRFRHWGRWAAVPEIERLIYRNPIALRMPAGRPAAVTAQAAKTLQDRMYKKTESDRIDLLQKFIEAGTKYPDVLDAQATIGVIMSSVSGAADTTASTSTGILWYLMTHAECRQKLEKELHDAGVTLPIPRYAETKGLPYLDAVIKESMRLFSGMNWPMERRVPAEGYTFQNHYFPPDTSIGILPAALHMDRSVYGEDVEVFRPERWLSGDAERTRRMEASFLGFSRGKRVCLGQNVAILQLKKLVPAMVLGFGMELAAPEERLEGVFSPAVVKVKPLRVRFERKG